MLFPSISFLFLFLPFVIGGYYILPKPARNTFLLLMSIVFYGWDSPKLVGLMLTVILINWLGALCITRFKDKLFFKKGALIITLLLNFGILGYFKYIDFLIENINHVMGSNYTFMNIILPLGISFYTFQAVSYTVDVYRGQVAVQRNFFKLALFISLFPQLIAGPIIRYHDIYQQIDNRSESFRLFIAGLQRFVIGLGKKVIIANTLAETADKILTLPADQVNFAIIWLGVISKGISVYFDFSGYSDMAIGLGLMFGFKFLENFNYPFVSKTISEFWRRWHISLGMWFREYVYFPLGGSRVSTLRHYLNLLAVFFLIGLWHGASWNFILWGVWFGLFIVLEHILGMTKESNRLIVNLLKRFWTLFIFFYAIVLIHTDTMPQSLSYMKAMWGLAQGESVIYPFSSYLTNYFVGIFIVAVLAASGVFQKWFDSKKWYLQTSVWIWLSLVFAWSVVSIVSTSYNPFIYFHF